MKDFINQGYFHKYLTKMQCSQRLLPKNDDVKYFDNRIEPVRKINVKRLPNTKKSSHDINPSNKNFTILFNKRNVHLCQGDII